MSLPSVMDEGVLRPDTGQTESHNRDTLDQAKIEMLSRQRPAALPNWIIETGFVTAVVGSMMMAEYTISGFNIALPALAEKLNIPESARTWPAAVPNLTTAVFLLPFSRLSERFGGRIIFLGGHLWLMLWSLVCGFSKNSTMLIVCRAMQGIGSSAFLPASLALMGQTYRPGPRKNLVFSFYGAFACIGFFFGIFIGGLASEILGWKWYFFIGAICDLFVTVTGLLTIPKSLGDSDANVKMDWPGVCTIVPGLALVVYALTDGGHAPDGWRTPYIIATFIIGVLLLCGAVYVQGWYSAQPFLPAELFRPKYMKRLVASLFCCYGVFGLFMFYASFYIESVLKATPLQTAAWFAPLAGGGLILALTGGLVLHLIPGRILLIISGLGFLASVLLFALIPEEGSTSFLYWAFIFPAMICSTIGVDIVFNVTNVFITTSMPRRLQAVAGALINSLLYLGMAFWLGVGELAVTATIDTRGRENVTERQQYQIGFWTAVGLSATSLILIFSVKMGQAAAEMTADEKAELELLETMQVPPESDRRE